MLLYIGVELIKYVRNLILPARCVLCGNIILDYDRKAVCKKCQIELLPLNAKTNINFCDCCGLPLISETKTCLRCRSEKRNFVLNRSIFKYSGKIKELIYQYKFNGQKDISFLFAEFIADTLFEYYPGVTIVPVPGRTVVKRDRGWEHVDLIAKILERKYKLPVERMLSRKGRKAQKTLTRVERAENLRKSITLRRNQKSKPNSVILLDDVFTTGTTINESSWVLKAAGVKNIYSLTIAID